MNAAEKEFLSSVDYKLDLSAGHGWDDNEPFVWVRVGRAVEINLTLAQALKLRDALTEAVADAARERLKAAP